MSWAARRRFIILLIVGAIVVAFLATVLISTFYKTPSCTDGVQNQSETGIDCGGSCLYLCVAEVQLPTILFTKALTNSAGRTDVVALIENKNATAAAKNVPYTITLYGSEQEILRVIDGTIDLPPNTRVPVYLAGAVSGQEVTSAFLEIVASAPQWFTLVTDPRIVPTVVSVARSGSTQAPRVETVITNPSTTELANVRLVVLIEDAEKGVIAASETIVPALPAQGKASAVFTWNSAFVGVPASIAVMPVIPLPAGRQVLP